MINWYGVVMLGYVVSNLINIALSSLGIYSILTGALLYLFGIPVLFGIFFAILVKFEQKGYIKSNKLSR
jgi:hypothetical protein